MSNFQIALLDGLCLSDGLFRSDGRDGLGKYRLVIAIRIVPETVCAWNCFLPFRKIRESLVPRRHKHASGPETTAAEQAQPRAAAQLAGKQSEQAMSHES